MEKKDRAANKTNVGLKDVLSAFWQGIKHHKISFYYSIFGVTIASVVDLVIPLQYKHFFDMVSSDAEKGTLVPFLVHIIFIVLLLNIFNWIFYRSGSLAVNQLDAKVMAKLREDSFEYMIDHSYTFFSNNFSGSLVQRVSRFVKSFENLFDTFVFNLIPLLVNIVVVIFILYKEQPVIAEILLGWAIVVMVTNYLFSIWRLKYNVRVAAADSKTTGYLADAITNQNTIASFAASDFETKGFSEVVRDQAKALLNVWNFSVAANAVQSLFIIAIEFILFYYAIHFWEKNAITVGTFVLIQVYVLGLAQKLWSFGSIIRSVYEGYADSKEMVEILKTPHEVADITDAKPLRVEGGAITFKDVTFGFNESRKVLEGINLSINPGDKVALIGPSGAGKSTIVKLLLRMYNLVHGEIAIDGQDIQKVTQESLRKNVSLVPQDPILFHRTLMENIRYGRQDATDDEVKMAAKLAHCDEFIDVLPDKYETFVGERGIKLSGGERQRVAIARAILKNAPILILDEATSSLDSHSEALIQDALDKLMKGKTSIVIAHRLSTIRMMDRIVVIKGGKVEEEGSHEDLLSKDESLYKTLWNLQAGGFIAE